MKKKQIKKKLQLLKIDVEFIGIFWELYELVRKYGLRIYERKYKKDLNKFRFTFTTSENILKGCINYDYLNDCYYIDDEVQIWDEKTESWRYAYDTCQDEFYEL
jgi:hypothetical protein